MAIVQKPSAGSGSSITSNASGSNGDSIVNANGETRIDVSDVALKVRKPYTISKQREKWTEEEHQKFIEALKLYGRAWRQIEEHVGTKTAVQIRSHAQKFFSKVSKDNASSAEASTEPIEIPPPRPKRKPLHPYPRKLVEAPIKVKQCPSHVEGGTSTSMKKLEGEAHSPTSVLSPEGSQISTSHVKNQGSVCVSRTSSGSNSSHAIEIKSIIEETKTLGKEKEGDVSLTLNLTCPLLGGSTLTGTGKVLNHVELTKDENKYPETRINLANGGGSPLKVIKLFGQSVAVANLSECSDAESMAMHLGTRDRSVSRDSCMDASKDSRTHVPDAKLALSLDNQMVPGGGLTGDGLREKVSSKGFSCTGSNNMFNEVKNEDTNLDSVDSKIFCRGFVPYKRCVSDREAASLKIPADDRESQRIRVYL